MKRNFILLVILFFAINVHSIAQVDLVHGKYNADELKELLIPQAKYTPFPKIDNRAAWDKADEKMMKAYVKKAEEFLDYEWPYIPATKSLLIARTGNRSEYEAISFQKRQVLGTLLLAEIAENKGRFIDQIIDGVWSICEESWWGVPAHLPSGPEYAGLIDVTDPFIDLFAAETAVFLSWVDYFLGEKLDAVSPQIRKRIYNETNTRIFEPAIQKSHWWMGEKFGGRLPNNWNPWICSNWLNAALILEKNDEKRAAMIYKITDVLDQFVNPYPADGGCDEGPSYWGAAAASLFDNLIMLTEATSGAFDYVFEDQKIKNMGMYIYRAQISEEYFMNFADADPKPGMAASMIYRFGKAIDDKPMMQFGAYYRPETTDGISNFHFFRNLYELFLQDEFAAMDRKLPLPKDVWLPDLQVMIARDFEGKTDGFFVAAKGGHNAESHNHNDIGNYMVFYDGLPLLIDVGRGKYTKRTFNNERYDIWYNCSEYHNLPTVNGVDQLPGRQFHAENVNYQSSKNTVKFSLDISQAYPESANLNSWLRTLEFRRGKQITITDDFNLANASEVVQHIMTCYPSELVKPGELVIHYQGKDKSSKDFVLNFDASKFTPEIEKIQLVTEEDQGILQKWGDRIYRINLKVKSPTTKDKLKFTIKER